ncbi:MAG: hypothetical protein JW910_00170 [Anaerolineae bacterium]|nr:hypothetical protein [Anaerolineae bacterium]
MSYKSESEAHAENVTLGLLILVFGVFLLLGGNPFEPLALLLGGLVLLGSAIYQTTHGWHVNLVTWALGLLLTLGGLGMRVFLVAVFQINWLAIGLLLVGGWVLYQAFFARRGGR